MGNEGLRLMRVEKDGGRRVLPCRSSLSAFSCQPSAFCLQPSAFCFLLSAAQVDTSTIFAAKRCKTTTARIHGVDIRIPDGVAANCRKSAARMAWLEGLPSLVREMESRWDLTLDAPLSGEDASCSYVKAVRRGDGTRAVLKISMPHMEQEQEIDGLRFWNGDPTVRLLESDDELYAMLLERCQPGTGLRILDESEQDVVISGLLRRLWRPLPTQSRK